MTLQSQILHDSKFTALYDHGFVGLVDIMGDDKAIADAARVSYGAGTKTVNEDRGLIRYLMRHQHSTPFEMVVFKFHLKIPIFVMRQHVRHRMASINEYSGRYSIMTDEFYLPPADRIQAQSKSNKQGSGDTLSGEELTMAQEIFQRISTENYLDYLTLLNDQHGHHVDMENRKGVARELSRIILPLNNYTELYWKIDLKNLFHYLKLRSDKHAQQEIRDLSDTIGTFVKQRCPIAWEAFEDYWQNAVSLSSLDIQLLNAIIEYSNLSATSFKDAYDSILKAHGGAQGVQLKYKMSKREFIEFENQWNLA